MSLTACIDIGNTRIKIGFYNGRLLDSLHIIAATQQQQIVEILQQHKVKTVGVLASGFLSPELLTQLNDQYHVIEMSHLVQLPIINCYLTPETLGDDRLAAVTGASVLFPNKTCVVIDAGTCVTFDVINNKAMYLGGRISPGLSMRYKALKNNTSSLPLLSPVLPKMVIGGNTNDSIHTGIVCGMIDEINQFIHYWKEKDENCVVIGTGGDINFFESSIKNKIFAEPNIVLIGLNEICFANAV